jgi:hypothetical protein
MSRKANEEKDLARMDTTGSPTDSRTASANEVVPTCPYCGNQSEFVAGDAVYPHRRDLRDRDFYLCAPCDAYVGCHAGTRRPLGRLANAELRRAKVDAHAAFDPIWRNSISRSEAYRWLATMLRIPASACHIGMFDVEQCRRVVQVVREARQADPAVAGTLEKGKADHVR